jgi:hypothetical protein
MEQDLQMTIAEETAVKDILKSRIAGLNSYSEDNAELLSYRLAEIMVLAKDLYTKLFPEYMDADINDRTTMWNQLLGIRMHLLHMRDCVEDFDAGLLELMEDEEKDKIEIISDIDDMDDF